MRWECRLQPVEHAASVITLLICPLLQRLHTETFLLCWSNSSGTDSSHLCLWSKTTGYIRTQCLWTGCLQLPTLERSKLTPQTPLSYTDELLDVERLKVKRWEKFTEKVQVVRRQKIVQIRSKWKVTFKVFTQRGYSSWSISKYNATKPVSRIGHCFDPLNFQCSQLKRKVTLSTLSPLQLVLVTTLTTLTSEVVHNSSSLPRHRESSYTSPLSHVLIFGAQSPQRLSQRVSCLDSAETDSLSFSIGCVNIINRLFLLFLTLHADPFSLHSSILLASSIKWRAEC